MPTLAQLDGGKCYVQILPDEVLVTIFEIGSTSSNDSYFPMIVSSVSSRWRQISLSAPSIWTSIHATVYDENTPTSKMFLFFERSKSRPLDITIEFGEPPFSSRAHRDLSDAISANSFRIRAIIARSETLDAFRDFAAPFNALPFPILTHLEIDSNATDCLAHHAPLFTGVKTLQSLVFPKCLACAPLGSELTHLEIRRIRCDVEEFRTIFETSPRLHTLILYKYPRYQENQENEPSPIQAPSLHTLIITFDEEYPYDVSDCGCLTSRLVACNLKRLEVYQTYKSASSYFRFDHHFRVYPALESLKIVDCILHAENSSFIQKLYNLTSLELFNTDHASLWESSESGDSSDHVPWQNLITVALTDTTIPGKSQMIQAIRRSCIQFPRSFTLKVDEDYHDGAAELHSDLPDAVLVFFKREPKPLIWYDADQDEEYGWSDTDQDEEYGYFDDGYGTPDSGYDPELDFYDGGSFFDGL